MLVSKANIVFFILHHLYRSAGADCFEDFGDVDFGGVAFEAGVAEDGAEGLGGCDLADGGFGDVVCEAGDEVAVVDVIDFEVFDGFGFDGERERDAPIDEAAEEEVHVGATVLDVADLLDEVLLGDFAGGVIDVLHVGVVNFQDAETAVRV